MMKASKCVGERERRFRVYKEAPGFHPGPRGFKMRWMTWQAISARPYLLKAVELHFHFGCIMQQNKNVRQRGEEAMQAT